MTSRHPTIPPDELADTADELEILTSARRPSAQIRAQGSGDREPVQARRNTGRVPRIAPDEPASDDLLAAYFDSPSDDVRAPATRDALGWFHRRLSKMETRSRWRKWGERVGSFLIGVGSAAFAWALAKADARGDARGAAREREVTWTWVVDTVRRLDKSDEGHEKQIQMMQDRLRYYPVQGPALPPQGIP